jgi:hypothetical protein
MVDPVTAGVTSRSWTLTSSSTSWSCSGKSSKWPRSSSNAWDVHEVPGPLEWVSADAPAEQQVLLLPSEYARRHLNTCTAGEDKLTTVDDVRANTNAQPSSPHVTAALSNVTTLNP